MPTEIQDLSFPHTDCQHNSSARRYCPWSKVSSIYLYHAWAHNNQHVILADDEGRKVLRHWTTNLSTFLSSSASQKLLTEEWTPGKAVV